MNVFISYCRQDEALAHLLSYVLTKSGIQCFVDRNLKTASPFDVGLKESLAKCDIVLLLLTRSSIKSAWVNQEVGYASALGKRIWPVAMEQDLSPKGMISTLQTYSLADWSTPDRTIDALIEALRSESKDDQSLYLAFGADQVLTNKLRRTKFLATRIRSLKPSENRKVTIYGQAAFSIFAFSEDDMYARAGNHSPEYMSALKEERDATEEILANPNVKLQLMLWPVRAYATELMCIRYDNLLEWMRKAKEMKNVEFKCFRYPGYNMLIVPNEFVLEGYKSKSVSGYDMSVLRYQPGTIEDAVRTFRHNWDRCEGDKDEAIACVEKMRTELDRTMKESHDEVG